jgi:hypothetical protein
MTSVDVWVQDSGAELVAVLDVYVVRVVRVGTTRVVASWRLGEGEDCHISMRTTAAPTGREIATTVERMLADWHYAHGSPYDAPSPSYTVLLDMCRALRA